MFQRQIVQGDLHRAGDPRRIGVFDLEAIVFAGDARQQVKLCAAVRGPEIGVARIERPSFIRRRVDGQTLLCYREVINRRTPAVG